ncbi:nicotinate-nucleotide adenylyltransferase [Exilibacterium tricleocarpae]|uniref:Multifunctional fusion protein n=2 Tax=Exilibacterium tricleocarpae TaxID=2591008 RepID=A0A545STG5_9GAMM|nr:nicotinate-nucleotide adenylyltransferase [Exilibacterium tricleocarpae]
MDAAEGAWATGRKDLPVNAPDGPVTRRRAIGLFGGTFDPIHIGHLRIALELQQHLQLDQMRLVPCHLPPHRQSPARSSRDRAAMVRLAVENCPQLTVDERELRRRTPSYTIDTLVELRRELGEQTALCLTLGMDSLVQLDTWHRWRELTDYAHLVVAARPGWQLPATGPVAALVAGRLAAATAIRSQAAGLVVVEQLSLLPISSTDIRRQIVAGSSPQYLLPDPVWRYICEHGLYPGAGATARRSPPLISPAISKESLMSSELNQTIIDALEDVKGKDIVRLDVRELTDVMDTLVIASGTSNRHVKSLASNVVDEAKEKGFRPIGVEGLEAAEWVLVDFGDTVLHVMLPATRTFYELEKLWSMQPSHRAED